MRLYFHHVGEAGSRRDFPKTVWKQVPIETVEENVSTDDPFRGQLLRDLKAKFPSGTFNCWGVPQGASTVIKHLQVDDVVLLVESIRLAGSVPALCQVDVFYPRVFAELSQALWGEHHFPYIFYFQTERLQLSWDELKDALGYAPRFDPRGQFYRVNESKPTSFKSQFDFVQWLRKERGA